MLEKPHLGIIWKLNIFNSFTFRLSTSNYFHFFTTIRPFGGENC